MANRSLLKTKISYWLLVIGVSALMRILPHPANIAPIAGLALFSGAKFDKKAALLLPMGAMILSDIFLGFHATVPFVYGSFILIALIGRFLKKWSFQTLFVACISSSLLFFFITNFGVWLTSSIYVKNLSGLMTSYLMGLPFLRNTIIGDLLYSFTFFYGFEYLTIILNRFVFVRSQK